MAIFGPTKEELINELSTILDLEGEKIPPTHRVRRNDPRLATLLKEPQVMVAFEAEYHGDGINIYKYQIVGDSDIHPCLSRERIRVILDDGTGVVLDSSTNPKDLLYFKKGRWVRRAHDLYIAANFQ